MRITQKKEMSLLRKNIALKNNISKRKKFQVKYKNLKEKKNDRSFR